MTTNPLLKNDNVYLRQTQWKSRPARSDPAWRSRLEHELIAAQDQWDSAEHYRREVDRNVAELTAAAKLRTDAEEKAQRERADAVTDDELKRRYLSGGGTESGFVVNHSKIRADFAMQVAIGAAQPITPTIEQTKAELKALRGHRLAQPS
jgi:hypothetical protein